ncbi:MAG: NAD-dependent epimerase/dehydratase family protein [Magnetococcales bacterium]|nr:NAD-dependent epimerase/dehydratase family protein [Magnetococcales bacterium]
MDKVVVIGGTGFMGSHTADVLSERGHKVVVYDHKPSPWLRDDQEMVVGDMLDHAKLSEMIKGARYLYHYAGIADIGDAKRRPVETIHLNVMGATIAMQVAVEAGVERFLYASTMYVYSPYGSFYRASKQASETVIEAYHEQFGLDYTLLRYGSLYGPRAQDWNGLRRYVKQIVQEGKLDYRGTGKERREYIHVRDAAKLSVDILDEQHKNQAITVTGQQILNSQELIDMMFEISGVEKNVTFSQDDRPSDHYTMTPYRYTPKRAKKLVPGEFTDIGEGILEVVEEIHQERHEE